MKRKLAFLTTLEDLFFLAAVVLGLVAGVAAFVETSRAYGELTQPAGVSATLECVPETVITGERG